MKKHAQRFIFPNMAPVTLRIPVPVSQHATWLGAKECLTDVGREEWWTLSYCINWKNGDQEDLGSGGSIGILKLS